MKILLDENMPHALRWHLRPHETIPAAHMGWAGWRNGEHLNAAESVGFDALVTGDLSLTYQQNMTGRRIAIVLLSTNNWPIMKTHVGTIVEAVDSAVPGRFRKVDCGVFSRKLRNRRGSTLG